MKILRSKGRSYTKVTNETVKGSLARGLSPHTNKILTPMKYKNLLTIKPGELPDYVAEDYSLILRQTISVLDKVIKKPNLRRCEVSAYVDRVLLADALWKKLCEKLEVGIKNLPDGEKAFQKFQDDWMWKAHPYAKGKIYFDAPEQDANAAIIEKFSDQSKKREDLQGRWHNAFWEADNNGKPNYDLIADRIVQHLFEQELQITGKRRKKKKEAEQSRGASGKGLLATQGLSIAKSANDPRKRKNEKINKWSEVDEAIYCEDDIAAKIYIEIIALDATDGFFNPARVGDALYKHFGPILKNYDEGALKSLWNLHNKVRQFYQKLLKSEHFRRAYREAKGSSSYDVRQRELKKLKNIVPEDRKKLLSILNAKGRNANLSELIRLGKLVAHASDLPRRTGDMQKAFEQRMDYLVTSEGQSEIKRNEAFIRVWRNSVGLSLQTLKAWTALDTVNELKDEDLAGVDVVKTFMTKFKHSNSEQFLSHLPLLFGSKLNTIDGEEKRRFKFFDFKDEEVQKEVLWAFLRLAGQIRNRTNHFNTKTHLVDIITDGLLSEVPKNKNKNKNFENRQVFESDAEVLEAFVQLLKYDKNIQNQVIADELNQLEITRYTTPTQLNAIISELSARDNNIQFTPPKFMAVLNRIKKVAGGDIEAFDLALEGFVQLELDNASLTVRGVNSFKVGILRQLYVSGFVRWLSTKQEKKSFVREAVLTVIGQKKERSAHGLKGKAYAQAHSMAEDMQLDTAHSLNELFGMLLAEISTEQRIGENYNANREKQRNASNWIDEFKQDIFAHFFNCYLESKNLKWLWIAKDHLEEEQKPVAIEPDDLKISHWEAKNWHGQFYAWLYLVPSNDIALLRHQIKKTTALEHISNGETDQDLVEKLADIDRLMGLYTRVQQAGFDGTEHRHKQSDFINIFYEEASSFEQVYSQDVKTHEISLSGTRKGLRQILRFGHFTALESIFKKHKITVDEVNKFTTKDSDNTRDIFENRKEHRKDILKLVEQKKPDPEELKKLCERYKSAATETALHNFKVNGARLSDHTRLHQLMIRIIGRLTDLTLMWERDRLFLFLGLLYSRLKKADENFEISIFENRNPSKQSYTVNICLPQSLLQKVNNINILAREIKDGNLPLWNNVEGIKLKNPHVQSTLLEGGDKSLFDRYFGTLMHENPKDVEAALLIKEENKNLDEKNQKQARKTIFSGGRKERYNKARIRNDFAHFNVIRKPLRLSYRINAVRSLLSYDRKLKNTVIKAINKILFEEGFNAEWKFEQDRVTKPLIIPRVETHLTMVREHDGFNPQFELPMNSVRFTSMVKALFDFDTGGYREVEGEGKNRKATGALRYPKEFRERHGGRIPSDMFNIWYESLPEK